MSFPASGFTLESATPIGLATIRLRYTQYPKVTDASASNDGLNPANYTLTGPSTNYITSVVEVTDDPLSVDLYLAAPLDRGSWTIAVANVISDEAFALTAPTSLTFDAVVAPTQSTLANGAVNMAVINVLRKHLNPTLRGKGWDSLIAAISAGDQINWDNAQLAFNQIFLSTASGIYLDRRAGDQGIRRPAGVEMSDQLFRELAVINKTSKLTQESVLDVLEVFYGVDALRASITTTVSEPFALEDGDQLTVLLDGRDTVTVTFHRNEFARIGAALAVEVAAAITRALRDFGSKGYATTAIDSTNGETLLRIYSGRLGVSSSVKVVGGSGQISLLFPQSLFATSGSTPFAVWAVSLSTTTPGNIRFTETSGIYDLSLIRAGDLAYVYGNEFESTLNQGTWVIDGVSVTYSGSVVQWFEIVNPAGLASASISQTLFKDLMFFRPVRKTIYDSPRHVSVAQVGPALDVVIPATTQVSRTPGQAAYGQSATALAVSSLVRKNGIVTVTTALSHGLIADDHVLIDGARSTNARPAVTAGTPSGNFASNVAAGTTDASLKSNASLTGTYEAYGHRALRLSEGIAFIVGGQTSGAVAVTNPAVLEITGETILGDGSRRQDYLWTNLSTHTSTTGHRDLNASLMSGGRVMVTGGTDLADASNTAIAAWDMFTYTRSPVQNAMTSGVLPIALSAHAQTTLLDGRVYISGGWSVTASVPVTNIFRFDVAAVAWTGGAGLIAARMRHRALALNSGLVLDMGGQINSTLCTNTCELYDPTGNTRTKTGEMAFARHSFGAIKLPDGRVLVVGGSGYNPTQSSTAVALKTCEIYDPAIGSWSPVSPMGSARRYPVVEYIASRNAIVVAGGLGNVITEQLDLATMTWSTVAVDSALYLYPLERSAGAIIGTDTLAIIGGEVDLVGTTVKQSYLVIPGADSFGQGSLNGDQRVLSAPTGTTFTYSTPGQLAYSIAAAGVTATPVGAVAAPVGVPGPFVFDPKDGVAVTSTDAVLATDLAAGQRYGILAVDDSSAFPDAIGYLVFNFGTDRQVGPVKYLSRISGTQLALDASFEFPFDVSAGSDVILLSQRGPWTPASNVHVGAFYVTGSAAGRIAAIAVLEDTVAAGIDLDLTMVYPGDEGLGGEGLPTHGVSKLSDVVRVYGGDDLDSEVAALKAQV